MAPLRGVGSWPLVGASLYTQIWNVAPTGAGPSAPASVTAGPASTAGAAVVVAQPELTWRAARPAPKTAMYLSIALCEAFIEVNVRLQGPGGNHHSTGD